MKTERIFPYATETPPPPSPAAMPAAGIFAHRRFTSFKLHLAALGFLVLAGFQFCLMLDERPVTNTAEARVAVIAREMVSSGDWLVPYISGRPHIDKPPLAPWMAALMWSNTTRAYLWLFRIPNAIAGVLAMLMIMSLGRRLLGRLGGAVCGAMWISSYFLVSVYRMALPDPYLAFFTLTAIWAWVLSDRARPRRAWRTNVLLLIAYIAAGAATLASGPIIFLHLALALSTYHLALRRRVHGGWIHIPGLTVMLAIAVPWPMYIHNHFASATASWLRNFAPIGAQPPWYHYLVNLPLMAAPWTLLTAMGICWPLINRRHRADRRALWPLAWLTLTVLLLTLAPVRDMKYLLPAMPAITLLSAAPVVSMLRPHASNFKYDLLSRALLNWHIGAAVAMVTLLTYMLARQLIDVSDFGQAFPVCSALAAAIISITLMRMAALQPKLFTRFAASAVLAAVCVHIVVAWMDPSRDSFRWRRLIAFVYQVNQLVPRAKLYSVGNVREDAMFYLDRQMIDLGNAEDIPPDFKGFAIVAGEQYEFARAMRHAEVFSYTGRDPADRLYLCYFAGESTGPAQTSR